MGLRWVHARVKRLAAVVCAPVLASFALAACAGEHTDTAVPGCGPPIKKPSGGYWTCTFADDFEGTALDTDKWLAQQTGTSGYSNGRTACFLDSPNNVSVSDGTLTLTAREERSQFTCSDPQGPFTAQYTSGMVSTHDRFSQTYGRFEIRARISATWAKGLQSALWLWPADPVKYGPWPTSGEIDIAEMFSAYPDRAIPYIHYNAAAPNANVTNNRCLIEHLGDFHTYAAEWTASSIEISYDGQRCLEHSIHPAPPLSRPQPFDSPFIVVLTQALGVGGNAFDPATTPLPATTAVDYVRVWK